MQPASSSTPAPVTNPAHTPFRWIGLSEDGDTVTLRKFKGEFTFSQHADEDWLSRNAEHVRLGAVLDTETTGLDAFQDQIIEIGLRVFRFDRRTGEVLSATESYSGLQDPGRPLSEEIQALTGLTDAMLAGQRIDWSQVDNLLSRCDVIIAHNAGFDRPFVEKHVQCSRSKIWACSYRQIDWKAKGFGVSKLEVLSIYHGYFVDAHRALNDVDALLHLLSMRESGKGTPYLLELLTEARQPMVRVVAAGSPFEAKDLLKRNGYRWDGPSRVWYRLVRKEKLEQEIAWLESDIYAGRFRGRTEEIPLADQFKGVQ